MLQSNIFLTGQELSESTPSIESKRCIHEYGNYFLISTLQTDDLCLTIAECNLQDDQVSVFETVVTN